MPFTPTDKYTGSRPGHVFKMGAEGLGYYPDALAASAATSSSSRNRSDINERNASPKRDTQHRDSHGERDRDRVSSRTDRYDRDDHRDRDRHRDHRRSRSPPYRSHHTRSPSPRARARDDRRVTDRHHGDRHDHRRTRDDDRYERSSSGRHRSRSRERDRERDRDRGSSSSSSRRDERGSSGGVVKSGASADAAQPDEPAFTFTAAQVAERVVEVFGAASKMRTEWLLECFDLDKIRVVAVNESEDLLAEGREEMELHFKTVPVWPVEATKRVYLESNKPSDPTFSLDFYPSKKAPGWGLEGLASETAERSDTWVLYKVHHNKIVCVWVADDIAKLSRREGVSDDDMFSSDAFLAALDLAIRPGGLTGTDLSKHYHDYSKVETWG